MCQSVSFWMDCIELSRMPHYDRKEQMGGHSMKLDILCNTHPEENEYNVEHDRAIDVAYSLAEEYNTPVDLHYHNHPHLKYLTAEV